MNSHSSFSKEEIVWLQHDKTCLKPNIDVIFEWFREYISKSGSREHLLELVLCSIDYEKFRFCSVMGSHWGIWGRSTTRSNFCFKIIVVAVKRKDCKGKVGKQENQLDSTRWWGFVLRTKELEIDRFEVYFKDKISRICWWVKYEGKEIRKERAKKDLNFGDH